MLQLGSSRSILPGEDNNSTTNSKRTPIPVLTLRELGVALQGV